MKAPQLKSLDIEQPNTDKSYLVSPVPSEVLQTALPEFNDAQLEDIGAAVMLDYLQVWGQTATKRIAALNKAAAAAGLRAVFEQEEDGKNSRWVGPDHERAIEFRKRLHKVWCGEFNAEVRNVVSLIYEFRRGAAA